MIKSLRMGGRRSPWEKTVNEPENAMLRSLLPLLSGFITHMTLSLLTFFPTYIPGIGIPSPYSLIDEAYILLISTLAAASCVLIRRRVGSSLACIISVGSFLALRSIPMVWNTVAGKVAILVAALVGALTWLIAPSRGRREIIATALVSVACAGLASSALMPVGEALTLTEPRWFSESVRYAQENEAGASHEDQDITSRLLAAIQGLPSAHECSAVVLTSLTSDTDCALMRWQGSVLVVNSVYARAYTDEELVERAASLASEPVYCASLFTRWI